MVATTLLALPLFAVLLGPSAADPNVLLELLDDRGPDDRRLATHQTSGLQCRPGSAGTSDTSVVFIHIFKAAGSTIRDIMRKYAESCDRSWACLIHCDKEDLVREVGSKKKKIKSVKRKAIRCDVKDTVNPPGDDLEGESTPRASELAGIDLLGGHVTYDLRVVFDPVPNHRVHFITVIRSPETSLISGFRQVHREWNFRQVQAAVRRVLEEGTLVTAAVKYLGSNSSSFHNARDRSGWYAQAMSNLRQFSLVGIMDKMDITMRMLEAWLDPSGGCPQCWVPEKRNPSTGFQPEDVLASLTDEERRDLRALLRDENALYQVGQEMFHSTCASILGPVGSRGSPCELGPTPAGVLYP